MHQADIDWIAAARASIEQHNANIIAAISAYNFASVERLSEWRDNLYRGIRRRGGVV